MEYKIIEGPISECQKKLNQWRHDYNIRVLAQSQSIETYGGPVWLVITLMRERK